MSSDGRRIAFVTRENVEPGSTAREDLFGLEERDWDPRLITPAAVRGGRLSAGLAIARAAVRRPGAARMSPLESSTRESRWRRRELGARMVAAGPRLVHFDSGRLAAAWRPVTDALGCPIVVGLTAEDLYAAGNEAFSDLPAVCAKAAAVHVSDRALEQRALQRGCPANVPRAVVPPSVDTDFYAPVGEGSPGNGRLRIVSAGDLDWTQGLEHAIHAVARARGAGVDAEYTIVGEGDHVAALTFARHQLGVDDSVQFAGPISPEKLRRHLREADVYLGATVVDGLTRPLLQALACGTPVVTSDAGLRGDAAIDERAAVVVPRRDPDALAEKLAALAADEGRRREMAAAARAWALEHVSLPRRRCALDRLFTQSLAQRGGPRPAPAPRGDGAQ